MTRTRILLIVLACLVLAVWSSRWRMPERPRGGRATAAPASIGLPAVPDTSALRGRLEPRAVRPGTPDGYLRNPFLFAERDADPRVRRAAPPAGAARAGGATAPPPHPSRPEMQLEGIAEEGANGHAVRTAIILVMGELALVKEGERLLGRYLVGHISADAVQLVDGETGESFTLVLR